MMGDNRDDSLDSRTADRARLGPTGARVGWYVPAENLVGRAEFIFFSHDPSACELAGAVEMAAGDPLSSRFFMAIH